MFVAIILLIVGFILLVKGADWFVEGSSSIAKHLRVPSLLIGLTIVAFGTSAPEAAVGVTASLGGANDIVLGNVIGSNIFNTLMVLGISAFFMPLVIQKPLLKKEFPFSVFAGIVIMIMAIDTFIGNGEVNTLTHSDGILILCFFMLFMYYLVTMALDARKNGEALEGDDIVKLPLPKSILFTVVGIIGVILGGQLVVNNSMTLAVALGASEALVGLTIVAVGTSLPELVTSIVAAKKGEADLAVGNIIGSNIFNLFFILGLSATISPIGVSNKIIIDILFMIVISTFVYFSAIQKQKVRSKEGIFMVLTYAVYMAYIVIRN